MFPYFKKRKKKPQKNKQTGVLMSSDVHFCRVKTSECKRS